MRAEAETFLSSMPQGLQDSQADAIIEAMAGYPEELRNVRQSRNTVHESSPDVEFVQIEGEGNARGIAMSLFKPEKPQPKPLPLLVYLHGGGWTFGSINSCAAFCDAVAATGKAIVLAVDYSLAPEKPYPKGLEDCIEAIKMAYAKAAEWGSCSSLCRWRQQRRQPRIGGGSFANGATDSAQTSIARLVLSGIEGL